MTDLSALIARLEAGSGEDAYETKADLACDIGIAIEGCLINPHSHTVLRALENSLDAALAFAEAVKTPIEQIQWMPNGVIANTFHACGVGVDAARACLIATLKALEAKAHD